MVSLVFDICTIAFIIVGTLFMICFMGTGILMMCEVIRDGIRDW